MTILTMIAALALQTLPAPATIEWESVGEDNGGRYAIDPASLARDGDTVRFLLRANASRVEADGVNAAVVRYVIDCRRRTMGAESADFYKPDGTFAYSRQRGAAWGQPEAISPQMVDSAMFRRACPGQ